MTGVDKIMRLIALAGNNPSAEEARTAAHLACKAIRGGGLVLLERSDPRLMARGWSPPPPPPPPPPPRPQPPPQKTYADAKAKAEAPTPRKRILLRFPGFCRVCKQDIPADEPAWWASGAGCICEGCY